MHRIFPSLFLCIVLLLAGCSSSRLYVSEDSRERNKEAPSPPQSKPFYSIFLLGDAGGPDRPNPVLSLLKDKADQAGEKSAILFLGDNIYPAGLPEEGAPGRKDAEARLIRQLDAVKGHPGELFIIPGNHDWNNSRSGGLEAVKRQEEFVESYLNRGNTFLPDDGFPGPVDIELVDDDDTPFNKDIRLILLNTEWWLTEHEKSFGDTGEYELHDAGDFLVELKNVIRDRMNDHVVVAGHHPLYSNGAHGGYFPAKRHLLPPVFGTLYVMYRKFLGYRQDIPHYRYREMKSELIDIFDGLENLVYAAGHDHSLQYFRLDRRRMYQHFLVSGGGYESDYVTSGHGADFTYQGPGLLAIRYYNDGSSWIEAWTPGSDSTDTGRLLYRSQLAAPNDDPFYAAPLDSTNTLPTGLKDSTVTLAPNHRYDEPGFLYRALMGAHNRDLWSIPIEVPVFDIETVEGGLQAVKMGGRGQSNTLRLENSEGKDFVLRSVDKVAGKVWDDALRNTIAEDLAQDQFAILNPFGALMIPPLADAIGVYHTNPRLYYIPNDPRLGEFANQAGGQLVLFEERPDNDMSHAPHFGNSEEVISTRDMLSEVDGDLDHRVDQEMMLRNRLFDNWISDWDRHEDQWRWASFEPFELDSTLEGDARTQGKIYRPIPRDRDVAFMRMNGLIPSFGKLTSFRNYQDFTESYGDLKGLTLNSLALTRRFTNRLTKEDWTRIAREMADALTDDVIEEAVSKLPPEAQEKAGDRICHLMKVRRDKLPEMAAEYYELVNGVVDVVGSHKKEYFEIERLDADRTVVRLFKRDEKDKKDREPYYERTFYSSETGEIRVYGLGDDDEFAIRGDHSNSTTVRVIGGSGNDRFTAGDVAGKIAKNVKLYDSVDGNEWVEVDALDIRKSDLATINRYDYSNGFTYNTATPLLFFGHNNDDGVFIGGGATFLRNGFQKYPFAASHTLRGNVAARTGAFNIQYRGRFTEVTGRWDGELEIFALTPNNIRNFLGLGNETKETIDDDSYYKARLWQFGVTPSLHRSLATGVDFSIGPFFQVTNIREDDGRFITQPQAGISENTFEDQWYTGFRTTLQLENVDDSNNPRQGFRFVNQGTFNLGVKNTSADHTTLGSALSVYASPSLSPQLTIATRLGAQHNIGPFPFYKANTLGGVENLRGMRSTRYSGRTNFFHNIEVRGKILNFNSYLLGGEAGMLGFVDHGRVWTDGEDSDNWHFGYGGGVWINIFRMTVMRASLGFAEDEWNVLVGAGFFF
ncbi:metallophosphoesterase [Aliifodinibius sp. S!AR15-10]|uniref:BamA/TamA family outer membrane protein n=1 Tax=Aliifodinibius sp. S!AR15-10 TaxID=2950437 RepID=UPI002860500E|nr:metallophosphoesterase [Aliifodinibius sp. S!AR15-10]MDR8393713.1 metallophosphoesterase [Aliifodinibius sp. S!AR15-10]